MTKTYMTKTLRNAMITKPLTALEYWELRDKTEACYRLSNKFPFKKNFLNCMEFAEDYSDYICKFEKEWKAK
jgi:hypothetical protein